MIDALMQQRMTVQMTVPNQQLDPKTSEVEIMSLNCNIHKISVLESAMR